MQTLTYKVKIDGQVKEVSVEKKGKTFFEIECLLDSPYTIEEEIQNWLDENGYEDKEYEFLKL